MDALNKVESSLGSKMKDLEKLANVSTSGGQAGNLWMTLLPLLQCLCASVIWEERDCCETFGNPS